LRITS
jgi:hypothetical protein